MLEREAGRRDVLVASLAVVAGLLAPVRAAAAPAPRKLFVGTELAANPLAAKFEVLPPGLHVSDMPVQTASGTQTLSALRSPATLVTLWAEFCAPCLMEMPDLARLGDRYRAAGFNVIALHIAGKMQEAKAKLSAVNAPTIPCWNEPTGALVQAVAKPVGGSGFSLPCNILVDRHGRVRGRAFGSDSVTPIHMAGRSLTAQEKEQVIHSKSTWTLPAGDQFAHALAGGLLDRIKI